MPTYEYYDRPKSLYRIVQRTACVVYNIILSLEKRLTFDDVWPVGFAVRLPGPSDLVQNGIVVCRKQTKRTLSGRLGTRRVHVQLYI